MDHDDIILGTRVIWGKELPFGLSREDRRQHLYIIGKTGTGKSTLLLNTLVQDVHRGAGVGVIDPHGELAEALLGAIPRWRTNDVVYVNPADIEWPISWNLLHATSPAQRPLVADGIVSAFRSLWRSSWGQRLDHWLSFALRTLVEHGDASILDVRRLFTHIPYRQHVLARITRPEIIQFWSDEIAFYERRDPRFVAEAVAPIHNRFGQLELAPGIRNVLGQRRNRVSPREIIDKRKIFIANLSKGLLGESHANLLGALLVTQFQQAAMSRANVPEHERNDFHLAIDEFHNYGTDAFAPILSELRKYRLALTLVHQYVDQIPEPVQRAIFGNVGSHIVFRISEHDAEVFAREFGSRFRAEYFVGLDNYHVCARVLSRGRELDPFFAVTDPPSAPAYGREDAILRQVHRSYCRRRADVERSINRANDRAIDWGRSL